MENHKFIKGLKEISGGIVAPDGFFAAGSHIGIKRKRKDLTLIKTDVPATAAGVFTQNAVKAPPVLWCKNAIKNKISGIVINSGIANACTGEEGAKNTQKMAKAYAKCLGVETKSILATSTGLIGVQLPIDKIKQGIINTVSKLDNLEESSKEAAEGIGTTDTFIKEIAIEVKIGKTKIKIGGIAKGSGMIHPNMATMLTFITTDAYIAKDLLQQALKESVDSSYNMISVDGDTSTNDMVIVLANGKAGNTPIRVEDEDFNKFKQALHYVNLHLAKQIVMDGEGVTKFLEVKVRGTSTKDDARKIAKSIITSNLVKTAMFGADANWGRILCAAGYAGVDFDASNVGIEFSSSFGSVITMLDGVPVYFDEEKALNILKQREIKILFDLEHGKEYATAWGCDLSYEYVRINGEYRT